MRRGIGWMLGMMLLGTTLVPLDLLASEDSLAAPYSRVLNTVVRDARVDYAALKSRPGDLIQFLNAAEAVSHSEFVAWPESRQIAYLINLYNAETLRLIIDHYPVTSIKKIGSLLKGPWDQPVAHLFSETTTLGHIEHDILRKRYQEPRIHFALVCAAKGCPPLRPEPYTSIHLDRQLEDQGRLFLRNKEKNRIDQQAKILSLSPIFDWFKSDFTSKAGSLEAFVTPYLSDEDAAFITKHKVKIRFTDYDWSLNDRSGGKQ